MTGSPAVGPQSGCRGSCSPYSSQQTRNGNNLRRENDKPILIRRIPQQFSFILTSKQSDCLRILFSLNCAAKAKHVTVQELKSSVFLNTKIFIISKFLTFCPGNPTSKTKLITNSIFPKYLSFYYKSYQAYFDICILFILEDLKS